MRTSKAIWRPVQCCIARCHFAPYTKCLARRCGAMPHVISHEIPTILSVKLYVKLIKFSEIQCEFTFTFRTQCGNHFFTFYRLKLYKSFYRLNFNLWYPIAHAWHLLNLHGRPLNKRSHTRTHTHTHGHLAVHSVCINIMQFWVW